MNDLKQFVEVLFYLELFMIKKCVEFSLTSLWHFKIRLNNKYNRNIKFSTSNKQFSYYWIKFLLLIISAIMPSNTINILCFFPGLQSSIFFVNILHII